MTPEQQVAFVRSYLTAFDVTFDSVYWEDDGVVVVNWQPYGRESDVIVGKAYELLSRARGERPFACGPCWADEKRCLYV